MLGPANKGGGDLAASFLGNRATQPTAVPTIQQPQRPATSVQMPLPTQSPVMGSFAPGAGVDLSSPTPMGQFMDSGARAEGFRTGDDKLAWLASLNQGQRNAYNRPSINESGSSIWSPTSPHWTTTNPEIMSSMVRWQMQAMQPQAAAAPSQAQLLARQINEQAQKRG